jgi:acyl-[acyl-carrier-protein]-phospholipid O-acyltransferase/long-chain-fatty-acid--[acyl-carrier-protein] ligase
MLVAYGLGGAGSPVGSNGKILITIGTVIFIAPFFFLSALGGELADRYDKARVAANIKLAEIPIAGLAAVGFYMHSVTVLFVTLGLFGIVAALFGPVKYGILPEKLAIAELPTGNAMVEGATFLAILIGTIAGGIAIASARTPEPVVAVIIALAVASWLLARAIPTSGPAAPNLVITRNPWTSTIALLRELKRDARLWTGGHIVSWFWLVGTVAMSLLYHAVDKDINGTEGVVTVGLATFTVGIAVGSGLAARSSHGTPNLGLVPLGAGLMGLFSLAIAVIVGIMTPAAPPVGAGEFLGSATGLIFLASLCGLAAAGGLFIVPAFAAVQAWAPEDSRARVIAAVNVMNAAYMLAGGAVVAGLQALQVGAAPIFAALGVLSLGAIFYVRRAWHPEGLAQAALKA